MPVNTAQAPGVSGTRAPGVRCSVTHLILASEGRRGCCQFLFYKQRCVLIVHAPRGGWPVWALCKAPAAADNQGRFWAGGSLPEILLLLSPPPLHCPWDRLSWRPGHQALTLSGRALGKPHPGCTYLPGLTSSGAQLLPLCSRDWGWGWRNGEWGGGVSWGEGERQGVQIASLYTTRGQLLPLVKWSRSRALTHPCWADIRAEGRSPPSIIPAHGLGPERPYCQLLGAPRVYKPRTQVLGQDLC